jgi:FAD/FMN-containing dehydrogenase
MKPMKRYESWGRYPRTTPVQILPIYWRSDTPRIDRFLQSVLPFGQGRSYGDSCQNDGGILLDTSPLSRFIEFDEIGGVIQCEAGVTLADILHLAVPRGWFLPVTPGTKYVSVGGAIANDVHGKNHHKAGTFGCHIKRFELLRSSGERFLCSPTQNAEYFRATIGGLGLTGLILWAELQLKVISNPYIAMEHISFSNLKEFFALAASSDGTHEYTVAWMDCFAHGKQLGRGVFFRGNHAESFQGALPHAKPRRTIRLRCDLPSFLLHNLTIRTFNSAYYYTHAFKQGTKLVHYDPFFYPLDAIQEWNRLYGHQGFLQYQCVVPYDGKDSVIRDILGRISDSRKGSFLGVLKLFGTQRSPGMLSFPRPGVTLAVDFRYEGAATLKLLSELDAMVSQAGGAVYPAKDARMSARSFQGFFPEWSAFASYVDPQFSSSFWRRVAVNVN